MQPYELPVALPVDPQLARRTAPVTLPPGGLAPHRSGQQQHAPVAVGDVADGPVREGGGRTAVERDRPRPAAAQARLSLRTEREHLPVGGPAAHLGLRTPPVRQPFGRSAVQRGGMHLGGAVTGGRPGDGRTVRGDARMVHRNVVGADPPGAARPVQRGDPDVVLGGEGDQIAVQMRKPEIRGGCGLCHPITLGSDHAPGQGFRSLISPAYPHVTTCPGASTWGSPGSRWSW